MAIIIGNFHSRQDLGVEMRKTCMPNISSLIALPKIGPKRKKEVKEKKKYVCYRCILGVGETGRKLEKRMWQMNVVNGWVLAYSMTDKQLSTRS